MLHLFLYGLLAILLAGGLFLLATRFLPAGEQIAPPLRDEPPWELPPERALMADDVDGVRLPVALRGYRFAETDLLLDRLAAELRARDAEIARLRGDEPPVEEPEQAGPAPEEPAAEEHAGPAPGEPAADPQEESAYAPDKSAYAPEGSAYAPRTAPDGDG